MVESIPNEIVDIAKKLSIKGFKVYLVGGCVRDIFLSKKPKDWDIATNAVPLDIQKIFPNSVYENKFGTVAVKTKSLDRSLRLVEITTFRIEGKYADKRHPDEIKFAKTIEEDLSRRDFTVNAMAMKLERGISDLVDPYGGKKDIEAKLIRCVGNPDERFNEDALRLMRAVRLGTELGFDIEAGTKKAIGKNAVLLRAVAKERIRDEFVKIIMSKNASKGVQMLEDLGLLESIIPELREGINCSQNKHHIYGVWEHNLRSLDYAASKGYSLVVRLAALLHDVGKPRTKRGEGQNSTFYGHEVVGARMAGKILERLRFDKDTKERVVHLVRYHLFYYNVGDVTEAGVRRFIRRVGYESIGDLIKVREADRIGSGVPKAVPYKLRHLLYMIEKVKRDPISPKMLVVDGADVMSIAKIKPGPVVGKILDILLDEVLESPENNEGEYLKKRILELSNMSEGELSDLQNMARNRKEEFERGIEKEMKGKFYIK